MQRWSKNEHLPNCKIRTPSVCEVSSEAWVWGATPLMAGSGASTAQGRAAFMRGEFPGVGGWQRPRKGEELRVPGAFRLQPNPEKAPAYGSSTERTRSPLKS